MAVSQAAISITATCPHSTMHRIAAPSTIETVVRWHCRYSVATWSARARARRMGATAVSGDMRSDFRRTSGNRPRVCDLRLAARRQSVDADPSPGELRYRLRARMNTQRLQDCAHVYFDGAFRQFEIATNELVGLALHEQLQHVGLAHREAELIRR